MARRPRSRTPPTSGATGVETLDMAEFARRLHAVMTEKGLRQSDLARAIWGTRKDPKTGYEVAKNRDRISVYLKGMTVPDPVNLKKLADALGVTPEELAPEITRSVVERENPEISVTAVAGQSERVLLRVNKLLPLAAVTEILRVISAHE